MSESKDNKKLITVLEGAITLTIGVLIAIFGIQTVLDLYFGILFLVGGVVLLVIEFVRLIKNGKMVFSGLLLGCALTAIGGCLLGHHLSLGVLIGVIVILTIAFGGALMIFGIFTLLKINKALGIGQILIGFLASLMGVLYLTVPGFAQAFWIVIGILIAIYGAFIIVYTLVKKK